MRRTLNPRACASGWQVSMNKGIVMNAWFDVPPMGPEMFSKVDQKVRECPTSHPTQCSITRRECSMPTFDACALAPWCAGRARHVALATSSARGFAGRHPPIDMY